MMRRMAYLFDPLFLEHDPGPGHPDSPARLRAIQDHLQQGDFLSRMDVMSCPPATGEDLRRIHTPAYIDFVLEHRNVQHGMLDGGDTCVGPRSVDAALQAAGTALEAVDLVLRRGYDRVFAAVRPPSHHALSDRAMGFCIFNNIALCAARALEEPEISRVLIVDWDVHHGNGTQEIFYESEAVFFLSLHQSPFFPLTGTAGETGSGKGRGTTRNFPLLPGKDDQYYIRLLEGIFGEIEEEFSPDLVLISAGFDAHAADPVGGMMLTEEGFREMTRMTAALADRHARGRVISFLEGGYDHHVTAASVKAHLSALMEK